MKKHREIIKYLDSFVNYERIGFREINKPFDLDKLRDVLKKLDNPQVAYRSIHVAGTKGKGSVSTFISSILKEAGFRVGLFTSPHLVSPFERIMVDGVCVSEEDMEKTIDDIKEALGLHAEKRFSYFEIFTLAAMLYFKIKKVDYAVFEVGMGGRLDATNVIDAKLCAITPISYDHTQILGDSLKKIAVEKAAIIKDDAYCVSAAQALEAERVIEKTAREKKAFLSFAGRDITCEIKDMDENGSVFNVSTASRNYKNLRTILPGTFQPTNIALAIGISEKALEGEHVSEDAFKRGIEKAFIPGRMEILARKPLIVIDGAQNDASVKALKESVERIFKYDNLILILGLSEDKDAGAISRELAPIADKIILTRANVKRAMDPNIIRGYVSGKDVKVTRSVKEALGEAFSAAGKNDLILATGSFFVIGEIKKLIEGRDRCPVVE